MLCLNLSLVSKFSNKFDFFSFEICAQYMNKKKIKSQIAFEKILTKDKFKQQHVKIYREMLSEVNYQFMYVDLFR